MRDINCSFQAPACHMVISPHYGDSGFKNHPPPIPSSLNASCFTKMHLGPICFEPRMAAIKVALCVWNKWRSARVGVTSAERMERGDVCGAASETHASRRGSGRPRGAALEPTLPGKSRPGKAALVARVRVSDGLWGRFAALGPAAEAANVRAGGGNRWAARISGAPLIHRE